MNWYEDPKQLSNAVQFLIQYSVCVGWSAHVGKKTPCCDFAKDVYVPEGLSNALDSYYEALTITDRRKLQHQVAHELGEVFYVKRQNLIKLLGRILANGDPTTKKDLFDCALQIQINNRLTLLDSLNAN